MALIVWAGTAEAQVRRGRSAPTTPRWAPPSLAVLAGLDQRSQGEVFGAHARIPVLRNGRIEVVPSWIMIFPPGERETQYDVDLTFVPGGLSGGVLVGAGLAWRESSFGTEPGEPLRRYSGYNLLVGGKAAPRGRVQLEALIRWTFLNDTELQPNLIALGVGIPLWRSAPQRSP